MDDLYGNSCASCGGMHNAVENTVAFSAEALEKGLREIYDGLDVKNVIERFIFDETLRLFNRATAEGLSENYDDKVITDRFLEQLRTNSAVFSAFRTHRMQNDIARLMTDEKGRLKPFEQFRRDVEPLTGKYCRNWLQSEYSTAVIRAHRAADWKRFEDEADVLPNLRWMPTTSPNQDPLHRQYWEKKLTLPVGHPFWDEHRPGDRWNCKCMLKQTDEPVNDDVVRGFYPVPAQPGLDGNPAKDGKIFTDTHPYFTQAYPGAEKAVKAVIKRRTRTEDEIKSIRERWMSRKAFNENIKAIAKEIKMKIPVRNMNFDEANELRGNPKYRIGRQYQINCQCSVVANEMRRRGFNVSAKPNRRIMESVPTRLSYQTELIWRDPETNKTPIVKRTSASTPVGMMNHFASLTNTAGRYHLRFRWNAGGGHIITFERRKDGSGLFYDPQTGRKMAEKEFYADRIKLSHGIELYRVDNLLVDTSMISGAVTK